MRESAEIPPESYSGQVGRKERRKQSSDQRHGAESP